MGWLTLCALLSFACAYAAFERCVRPDRTNRQDLLTAGWWCWLLGLAGGIAGMVLWERLSLTLAVAWR